MKIFIMTDLEGISGIDHIDMIGKNPEGYEKAREYLMLDVNTTVRGLFDGGAIKRDASLIRDGRRVTRRLDKISSALDIDWF